jgi:hypothetical protein
MPIGGRTSHASNFLVRVATGSAASERVVIETISENPSYHARDLAYSVSDWVSECAVALLQGKAEYELLVYERVGTAIVRRRLFDGRSRPEDNGIVKARVVSTLPDEEVGDMLALRRAFSALADPFAAGKLFGYFDEGEKRPVPFEYELFRREEAHVLARATAFLGWNARVMFHPEHGQNAYHFIYRELKFHRFKAMLRGWALLCLNRCLRLAGEETGQPMGVEVVGLPTEHDVAQAMTDLEEGQTPFLALLDRLRI